MGSSFFGLPNIRNGKSSSSSSSSKKSKKSSSDKPKQPQRGLGVAQLEQIRLRSQLGCGFTPSVIHSGIQEDLRMQGVQYGTQQSSSFYHSQSSPSTSNDYGHHHPNYMMAFGNERASLSYQDSHPSTAPRWNPNSTGMLDNSTYSQAGMASQHLVSYFEDSRIESMGSGSHNYSESSEHEDVDLELRLSL